ncbi:MAG: hypothetical protein ABIT01_19615 [Thermoanaerobaculia bacterium]
MILGGAGVAGLSYKGLRTAAKLAGRSKGLTPSVFSRVQVLEREFVRYMNRKPKKKG